jgi:phage shock protein PspC (stress-responsive transcriptional regulator)
MARRDQTLYRDESDKMLGGVCSGLAQYFDVDTNLARVAFIALSVFGGGGVIAYLLLWAILDPKPMAGPLPSAPEATVPDIVLDEPAPLTDSPGTPDPVETSVDEAGPAIEQTPST